MNLRNHEIFVCSSNGCYAGALHEMRYVLVTDDRAQGNDWRQLPDGDQWQWSRVMWGTNESITHCRSYSYTPTLLYSQFEDNKKEVLLFWAIVSYNDRPYRVATC